MTLLFRPAAAADVEDAYVWYEGQRVGLGEECLAEVGAAVARVLTNPHQYPVLHRATRRALLHRFPYGLFYRVVGAELIVVACMHAKRDPRRWQARR